MTRTTQPTTKAERDEWRAQVRSGYAAPVEAYNRMRLLDDADERDALRRRVAVLDGACNLFMDWVNKPRTQHPDELELATELHPIIRAMRAALSASPPVPPDPNADIVRRLEKALLEFGKHPITCWHHDAPETGRPRRCNCGLGDVLADAAALRAGAGGKP